MVHPCGTPAVIVTGHPLIRKEKAFCFRMLQPRDPRERPEQSRDGMEDADPAQKELVV